MPKSFLYVFLIWLVASSLEAQQFAVSGYVYDHATGETLIGVRVQDSLSGKSTVTNTYGFYTITLPSGACLLRFTYLGFANLTKPLRLGGNVSLSVRLGEDENLLQQVVISASGSRAQEHVKTTEMGKLSVPMELLKRTPVLFGENDLIKAIQLMPGVKRGGEGTVGMFVRGGGSDENLILLDEAPVYNVGHALGFLSVFNTNAIKHVELYKGAFPAQYGGRLSSILDVRMREGNDQRLHAQGSIGNIASNLSIEGPIVKEKGSFIISGRRSYLDRLVDWLTPSKFPYYFYDLNAKLNYKTSEQDRFFLSSYFGRDVLAANAVDSSGLNTGIDTRIGNYTVSARWNHIYPGQKIFHNVTLVRSQFRYNIAGEAFGNNILIRSAIDDYAAKADFDYRPSTRTTIKMGAALTHHIFRPNLISVQGDISDFLKARKSKAILNQEFAAYVGVDNILNPRWRINFGLRLSGSTVERVFYSGYEPRLSARYQLNERHSLKIGYARMTQYLHLVASSSLALPTDLWYPVTKNVRPGASDQWSVGWFTYFGKNEAVQVSVELYSKKLYNMIEYREGARLLLNDNYEAELVRGTGDASGIEWMLQKNSGRWSGWIGYTLSWATRLFPDLNGGTPFYARYDRRHDFSIVANHDFTKRFGFSFAWVYSSGSPFTPIVSKYVMPFPNYSGVDLLAVYPLRNSYRLNASHRLDIDFMIKGRKRRHWQGEWHFGAYNFYNRTQPNRVSIVFDEKTGKEKYQERGLFGVIGSLSYNFKF